MKIFDKKSVGVDISDRTIEVVEAQRKGSSIQILNYNRVEIPLGIIERGKILKEKELAEILSQAFKNAKPKPITDRQLSVFLPESQVFVIARTILSSSKADLAEKIEQVIEEQVPHSLEDLTYVHQVRSEAKGKTEVVIVASPTSVITQWRDFFSANKYQIDGGFDLEILADARAVIGAPPAEPICVVDLGKRTTSVSIFDKKGLAYSYSIAQAGDSITQAVASETGMTLDEAEAQKISFGMKGKSAAEKKVSSIIEEQVAAIIEDLQNTLTFFFQKSGVAVAKVFLLGGTSELPGLVEYAKDHLKASVEPAEASPSIILKGVSDGALYLGAIGTAMRGVNLDPLGVPLAIVPAAQKGKKMVKAPSILVLPGEEEAAEPNAPISAAAMVSPMEVTEAASRSGKTGWFKAHRKETMLIGILAAGILLLVAALFYQNYSRAKRAEDLLKSTTSFNFQKSVQVRLPLQVGNVATANTARGSIITTFWDPAANPAFPTAEQAAAEKSLSSGLTVWQTPIRAKDQKRDLTSAEIAQLQEGQKIDGLQYPLTLEWLVISDQDVEVIALSLLKNLLIGNPFILNNFKIESLEPTNDPDKFILTDLLDVSLNKDADLSQTLQPDNFDQVITPAPVAPAETAPSPAAPAAPTGPQVLILASPTGYVNVRSQPSTTAAILGRAIPGETYPYVGQQGNWLEINFKGANGWVITTYAKKQ